MPTPTVRGLNAVRHKKCCIAKAVQGPPSYNVCSPHSFYLAWLHLLLKDNSHAVSSCFCNYLTAQAKSSSQGILITFPCAEALGCSYCIGLDPHRRFRGNIRHQHLEPAAYSHDGFPVFFPVPHFLNKNMAFEGYIAEPGIGKSFVEDTGRSKIEPHNGAPGTIACGKCSLFIAPAAMLSIKDLSGVLQVERATVPPSFKTRIKLWAPFFNQNIWNYSKGGRRKGSRDTYGRRGTIY